MTREQDPPDDGAPVVPMGNYVTNQGGELRDGHPSQPGDCMTADTNTRTQERQGVSIGSASTNVASDIA